MDARASAVSVAHTDAAHRCGHSGEITDAGADVKRVARGRSGFSTPSAEPIDVPSGFELMPF